MINNILNEYKVGYNARGIPNRATIIKMHKTCFPPLSFMETRMALKLISVTISIHPR